MLVRKLGSFLGVIWGTLKRQTTPDWQAAGLINKGTKNEVRPGDSKTSCSLHLSAQILKLTYWLLRGFCGCGEGLWSTHSRDGRQEEPPESDSPGPALGSTGGHVRSMTSSDNTLATAFPLSRRVFLRQAGIGAGNPAEGFPTAQKGQSERAWLRPIQAPPSPSQRPLILPCRPRWSCVPRPFPGPSFFRRVRPEGFPSA